MDTRPLYVDWRLPFGIADIVAKVDTKVRKPESSPARQFVSLAGEEKVNLNAYQIAQVCHEANREYCRLIGDYSQEHWDKAEQWQRDSAIKVAEYVLSIPEAPASAVHEAWLNDKKADGWIYGPIKDATKKEHPCMVPYWFLPIEQRLKDRQQITWLTCDDIIQACSNGLGSTS